MTIDEAPTPQLPEGFDPCDKFITELKATLDAAASELCDKINIAEFASQQCKLPLKLKLYAALRQIKECCDNLSSTAGSKMVPIAASAVKIMMANDTEEMVCYGYKFTPDEKVFVSCPADEQDRMLEWMRSDEEGRELINETVHPKTLEAFVKRRIADDKQVPFVNVYTQPVLTVRKKQLK